MELLVLFPLFVLGMVALVVYAFHRAKKRREAIAALAQRLGLQHDPSHRRLDPELRALEALSSGSNPRVRNELRGAYKGLQVRCFDFHYEVRQGKNRTTLTRGVAMCDVPRAWPRLLVVPENVGHKLMDALGADDIDFESQAFSDAYWVRSDDARFAYAVIDPRMMDHLMSPRGQRWEIRDGRLCTWTDRGTWSADEIPLALDRLAAFLERVPAHVRAQEGFA